MKKIVLIRQRPSIGDCLLLGPLIREIKKQHPKDKLTVITDSGYCGGALPRVFAHIPGIDRIETVPSVEWTTPGNRLVDPMLNCAIGDVPISVRNADLVFDCNSGFMQFERDHMGNTPYGISEFWLKHFKFYKPGMSLSPIFHIDEDAGAAAVDQWAKENNVPRNKPWVGIVLRSGASPRDWNYDQKAETVAIWLYTNGYVPISIDPINKISSPYTRACMGKPLDFVAALIKECKTVLTPDTGILHLAEAMGTSTVALWGILEPELRLKGYNTVVVPNDSLGLCEPENAKYCPCCSWTFQQWSCMRKITSPMIIEGLRLMLK